VARRASSEGSVFSKVSPDALGHLDSEGLKLLSGLTPSKRNPRSKATKRWEPEVEAQFSLSEKDMIGGMVVEKVDPFTMEKECISWDSTGMVLSLEGGEYRRLVEISHKMSSLKPLSGALSASTAKSLIIKWITAVRTGATRSSLSEWQAEELAKTLRARTVCVPIAWLHVQSEVRLGKFRLVPLNSALKDAWRDRINQKKADTVPEWKPRGQLAHAFNMAWAGLIVEVFGDSKARESQALQAALEVCGLLRFFWPGNSVLGSRCFVLPLGMESPPQRTVIEIEGDCPTSLSEGLIGPPGEPIILSDKYLSDVGRSFSAVGSLITRESPSEFQRRLLASLLLYTRNSLHTDVVDRLIAVLVALESILLRDKSEPIQSSLAQRLAVVTKDTVEERAELIGAVRRCYDIRSTFLHHGLRKDEDRAAVELLLKTAWLFFMDCILNHEHVLSMQEFNARVDAALLGGPRVDLHVSGKK
jgi:hypothetical protein